MSLEISKIRTMLLQSLFSSSSLIPSPFLSHSDHRGGLPDEGGIDGELGEKVRVSRIDDGEGRVDCELGEEALPTLPYCWWNCHAQLHRQQAMAKANQSEQIQPNQKNLSSLFLFSHQEEEELTAKKQKSSRIKSNRRNHAPVLRSSSDEAFTGKADAAVVPPLHAATQAVEGGGGGPLRLRQRRGGAVADAERNSSGSEQIR